MKQNFCLCLHVIFFMIELSKFHMIYAIQLYAEVTSCVLEFLCSAHFFCCIIIRISTTREMCTALKNHCIKIDTALAKGQEDKEKLFRVNQERLEEYEVSGSCISPSHCL